MGKKAPKAGLRNKLREEYAQLQHELRQLNQTYDDIFFSVVQGTAREYLNCKNHFFLRRKNDIKRMIKGCIEDSVILKFPQQRNTESRHEETHPARSLLAAAKQFSEATEEAKITAEIRFEIEHLNTEELQRKIRKTKTKLSEIKGKIRKLYQEVISLREGYEASYEILITFRRYLARKRMLKSFIARNSDVSRGTRAPLSRY